MMLSNNFNILLTMNKLRLIVITLLLSANLFAQTNITEKEVKEHISILASDELNGRYPGTEGDTKSQDYIIQQFNKVGLNLKNNGKQKFSFNANVKIGKKTYFKLNNDNIEIKKEVTPLLYSANKKLKADVAFVGFGIVMNKEDLKWDDYKKINVRDKWVLILRGDPDNAAMKNRFTGYSDDLTKIKTAINKNAKGVIFVSGVEANKDDEIVNIEYQRGGSTENIPVFQIKRSVADKILAKHGKKIEELEKEYKKKNKPESFICSNVQIDAKSELIINKIATANVYGFIEGNDSELKKQYIIIGGHFDHLGMGGYGSGSRKPDTNAVHNGADDNASGIAAMLEIAEYFSNKKNQLKYSLLFVAFAAEEKGLLGSKYFVNNPIIDLSKVKLMVNLDMIGRLNEKPILISGVGSAKELEAIVDNAAENLKIAKTMSGYGPSDHSSFYGKNIPVLSFYTGAHQDYHTPEDDIELVDFKGVKSISDLVVKIVKIVAQDSKRFTYIETGLPPSQNKRTKLKATLGIMPDFSGEGTDGMRVDGVRKGGPAYEGGIHKGDKITAINKTPVKNIYGYMEVLSKHKPGEIITVEVLRGEDKLSLIIQL